MRVHMYVIMQVISYGRVMRMCNSAKACYASIQFRICDVAMYVADSLRGSAVKKWGVALAA